MASKERDQLVERGETERQAKHARILHKHPDALKAELRRRWVGREEQLDQLIGLVGRGKEAAPSVIVCGGCSTGKTSIVKDVLRTFGIRHAYVNCTENSAPRRVLLSVLSQVKGYERKKNAGYTWETKCDRLADFLPALAAAIPSDAKETTFVVLDQAEKLRKSKGSTSPDAEYILSAFLRLQELCGRRITTLLISKLGWNGFHSGHMAEVEPATVFFPSYSQDEIIQILCQSTKVDDLRLYTSFLGQVLPSLMRMSVNLRDLGFLTNILYSKYIGPIEGGLCSPSERRVLWQFFSGIFRAVTQAYQMGDDVWRALEQSTEPSGIKGNATRKQGVLDFEIPYDSKVLLLAAFIASRNPASLDASMFENKKVGKRRRNALASDRQVVAAQEARLKAPGPFPLERLIYIYNCLLDVVDDGHFASRSERCLGASFFQQLNGLVGLKLVSRVSPDPLDATRYRCNLDESVAEILSRNVKIPLHGFLRYA